MIRRLHLERFKSFDKVNIPLGPITLMVGANASGKSNVRDALRFVLGAGLGFSAAEILGEKYGPGGALVWRGIRGGALEVVHASGTDRMPWDPWTFAVTVVMDGEPPTPVEEGEEIPAPLAYRLEVSARPDDVPMFTGEDLVDPVYLERWQDILPRVQAQTEVGRGRAMKKLGSKTAVIEQWTRGLRFLDLHPDAMRLPSVPGQTVLGDRGENLSSVLQSLCEDPSRRVALLEWVRALTPMDAVDFDFKVDFTGRVLVHLVEANGRETSAWSASDGTLRFLAMVAAVLSDETGRTLFFEEIDTGIHPSRLHVLLQMFRQLCTPRGIQIIATTHNPMLLTLLDDEARQDALLVWRPPHGTASRVIRVADLPGVEQTLQTRSLGELMTSGWLEDMALFAQEEEERPPVAAEQADPDWEP